MRVVYLTNTIDMDPVLLQVQAVIAQAISGRQFSGCDRRGVEAPLYWPSDNASAFVFEHVLGPFLRISIFALPCSMSVDVPAVMSRSRA